MKKVVIIAVLVFFLFKVTLAQNIWTQKADFGGGIRRISVAFSIGGKGYLGSGNDSTNWTKDFWEYDPSLDIWTRKSNFGGGNRSWAVGFSIGNKGYLGLGIDTSFNPFFYQDFWEYDQSTDNWNPIANLPAVGRVAATGFSINNKGYIVTGSNAYSPSLIDLWEYEPISDSWLQKANFPGQARQESISFTIGQKAYFGLGFEADTGVLLHDIWSYDPNSDSWTQLADFPQELGGAASFTIGNYGYVVTGLDYLSSAIWTKKLWRYDVVSDMWTQLSNFGGTLREDSRGFAIAGKGYVGTGFNSTGSLNDWWEFTPDSMFSDISELPKRGIISVYPNPFNNITTIGFNTQMSNGELIIYNIDGTKLKTISGIIGNEYKLLKDNLSPGIYIAELIENKKTIGLEKLIITETH